MLIHTLDLNFLNLEHSIAVFAVEGPNGKLLVETGPYSTWPVLEKALDSINWKLEDVGAVLLSHIHFDHAGAAWAWAERGVPVYVHPKGLPHLASPERLYNSARQIYGEQMDRLWGEMRPIDTGLLHAPEHGARLSVAGLQCTAWYTPGHASHHIAWEIEDASTGERTVFTGDVAGVRIDGGPVVPPCPPPDIQVEDWKTSIALLRELNAPSFYLTHFGRVTDTATHLDKLEMHLTEWAEWMRPYAEQQPQPSAAELVPKFEAYVKNQLADAGCSEAVQNRYEASNPAFMSVAGLLRYWSKKLQA